MTAAQGEMFRAACRGDIDAIIAGGRGNPRLLVEGLGSYGWTALWFASYKGHVKGS